MIGFFPHSRSTGKWVEKEIKKRAQVKQRG